MSRPDPWPRPRWSGPSTRPIQLDFVALLSDPRIDDALAWLEQTLVESLTDGLG